MICQEAMLGCPGLGITTWGRRELPKCRRHPSGVWCGGKISRGGERAAAAGPAPGFRLGRQPQSSSL